MLTLRDIIDEARLALRGDLDQRIPEVDFANRVGRRWVGMHDWQYLRGRAFSLTTVDQQQEYELPANLSEVVSCYGEPNEIAVFEAVKMVRPDDWHAADRRDFGNFYGRFLGYIRYDDVSGAVVPRLYLTPKPQEARGIRVVYRAGWDPLVDADSVADVPPWAEEAFRDLVRGLALALHRVGADPTVDMVGVQLERVRQSRTFQDAITQDGLVQPEVAPGIGGMESILAIERKARYTGPRWTTQDLLADI